MNVEFREHNGRKYLTLKGLNTLRASVGLDPIRYLPGEDILAYFERAKEIRRQFFRDYGHLLQDYHENIG